MLTIATDPLNYALFFVVLPFVVFSTFILAYMRLRRNDVLSRGAATALFGGAGIFFLRYLTALIVSRTPGAAQDYGWISDSALIMVSIVPFTLALAWILSDQLTDFWADVHHDSVSIQDVIAADPAVIAAIAERDAAAQQFSASNKHTVSETMMVNPPQEAENKAAYAAEKAGGSP